jgi:kumamolisin
MAFENKIKVPGSERKPMPGSRVVGSVDPEEVISVSIILRHQAVAQGNNPQTMQAMEDFAHEHELTVAEVNLKKRRIQMRGTLEALSAAFGADLKCYQIDDTGPTFRGRTGTLSMPAEFKDYVLAVLGLDSRPVAKPHFRFNRRKHQPAGPPPGTFTPPQVAKLYNYPSGANGSGQTVAIIELGGGFRKSDLKTYFQEIGVKQPSVTAVSVDGGHNSPGGDADGEVMLDIEVAGAIAPGASYAVYFAPNTDQGFVDAITDAVHDTARKPSVISISWGGPEDSWTEQGRDAMNAALQDAATLGVTVTVAAGDNGSTDGVGDGHLHVDFPASSPYVLACGGTKLAGSGSQISSETVWNETANKEGATGGGISKVFALPSYQASAKVDVNPETKFAGRGVPDVAGVADPVTGYAIRVDGQNTVVGGTSAVAPQWAALVAILNQELGKPVGFINPTLYSLPKGTLNDISQGNNDDSNLGHYSAGSGWDACTGLGTANGSALLDALQGAMATTSAR